jgi:hypothetical protein
MYGGAEVKRHTLTFALDAGEWSASRFDRPTYRLERFAYQNTPIGLNTKEMFLVPRH